MVKMNPGDSVETFNNRIKMPQRKVYQTRGTRGHQGGQEGQEGNRILLYQYRSLTMKKWMTMLTQWEMLRKNSENNLSIITSKQARA